MINNGFSWLFRVVFSFPFLSYLESGTISPFPMTGAGEAEQSHGAGGNESRELHALLGLHPVQFLASKRENPGAGGLG